MKYSNRTLPRKTHFLAYPSTREDTTLSKMVWLSPSRRKFSWKPSWELKKPCGIPVHRRGADEVWWSAFVLPQRNQQKRWCRCRCRCFTQQRVVWFTPHFVLRASICAYVRLLRNAFYFSYYDARMLEDSTRGFGLKSWHCCKKKRQNAETPWHEVSIIFTLSTVLFPWFTVFHPSPILYYKIASLLIPSCTGARFHRLCWPISGGFCDCSQHEGGIWTDAAWRAQWSTRCD